jgi:hypothetical protein
MTERIRELALQAANEVADLFSPGFFDDRMVYNVADINEKLAQLIVQECANMVNSLGQHEGPGDSSTAEYIKQHFGVKR